MKKSSKRPGSKSSSRAKSRVATPLHSDLIELLNTFNEAGVRYLVVGAHAVMYYTQPRYTKDLDLWIDPGQPQVVFEALRRFGAPLRGLKPEDFGDTSLVYQMGVAPVRADILTGLEGLRFDEAWEQRSPGILGGVSVFLLGRDHLLGNKRSAGRSQDVTDVKNLLNRAARK